MAAPLAPEDLLDIIQVLKKQEISAYRVLDYLNPKDEPLPHDDLTTCCACQPAAAAAEAATADADHSVSVSVDSPLDYSISTASSSPTDVNEEWRSKICEWSYQVIDHFDYDREIVAVSLHYLDRYLCRRSVDKRTFQLVAMTCLYMACKLYSPRHQPLSMDSLMQLSRGYFTEEHIEAMEGSILTDLGWYVHPPTPLTFAKHFVLLLDSNACSSSQVWHDMMEVAKFLTELAVNDYHFAPLKPSSVGLAALMTSMEEVSDEDLPTDAKEAFAANVCQLAHLDPTSPEVMDCRIRLREVYFQTDAFKHSQTTIGIATPSRPASAKGKVERIKADSPTGVDEPKFASFGPSSDTPPLNEKEVKDDDSKMGVSSSHPFNEAALTSKTNTTSSTSSTSTAKTTGSTKTKTSACTSVASKAKKLRKAILPSQEVEDAKKRRMG